MSKYRDGHELDELFASLRQIALEQHMVERLCLCMIVH